ncbi:MAG: hypothetical protein GY719_29630 [bacterium]|nr:hypothetical protein [bacterium]
MDSELVIGVLMVIFWLLSSLVAKFGKSVRKKQQTAESAGSAPPAEPAPAGGALQKMLQDLAEQMGLETEASPAEPPVASEHVPTGSEHRRSAIEIASTVSEHRVRASDHRRTASEQSFGLSEHQLTASEHQWGDLVTHRLPKSMPGRRSRSKFVRRIHADLAGGRGTLARAIVLREILGPPVGLRSPEQ